MFLLCDQHHSENCHHEMFFVSQCVLIEGKVSNSEFVYMKCSLFSQYGTRMFLFPNKYGYNSESVKMIFFVFAECSCIAANAGITLKLSNKNCISVSAQIAFFLQKSFNEFEFLDRMEPYMFLVFCNMFPFSRNCKNHFALTLFVQGVAQQG
jgi:hypothetical protein